MYKTETHLHTAEVSRCSKLRADEMVKCYHEAGYKTIIVTDHFSFRYMNSLGDIPWEDKITIFFHGFYKAREAAKQFNMNVLMAAEITFPHINNDYLAYGVTKEFFVSCPNLFQEGLEAFYKKAKEHNVLVVQAHPYRDGKCFPTPQYVDGIEVYNSNPRHNDYNEKAENFAGENNLYCLAGSDAHRLEDLALSGILTKIEIKSSNEFIEIIKSGQYELMKE
ncbi:MAG: PHP domain-containing protein [Lachnospiraceae bacterium]|nr:PHP domain-containing protein [Lachnospiraceae bacterium]